jgi:hypothetical protein
MTKLLASCALAAVIFAASPQALKATNEDALCRQGNATVRGTYIAQGTGSIAGVGPISTVGVMTFDGKGTGVLTATFSLNGAISKGSFSGPYTLNSDCTMTLTFSNGTNYDGVVAPDGSIGNWIETDTGTVLSGTMRRIGAVVTGTDVGFKATDARDAVRQSSRNRDAIEIPLDRAAIECVHVTRRS